MARLPPWSEMTAGQRVLVGVAIFVLVGVGLGFVVAWEIALLGAWIVAASFVVAAVWLTVSRLTAEQTSALATREDNSRIGAQALLLLASVGSLAGVAFELVKAGDADGMTKVALTALGIVTVLVSWGVLHTVFALRYAHEFYSDHPGGVDFGEEMPDYTDFAYLAFTVGMTYQVSDTQVGQRLIRRTVLRHALMSYLFGAVILAVTVNAVAGLVN